MKIKLVFCLLAVVFCSGCGSKDPKAKWQKKRANIINVKDDIKEIDTDDVLIGSLAKPYICGGLQIIRQESSSL